MLFESVRGKHGSKSDSYSSRYDHDPNAEQSASCIPSTEKYTGTPETRSASVIPADPIGARRIDDKYDSL